MDLSRILKSLIVESATIDQAQDAIKKKQIVIISYDGDEPGGKGLREIEPVALGKSKKNNLVIRAWDEEGASHRGYLGVRPMPGWRMFKLEKILSWQPTGETQETARPNYNPNGDKDMISVIINAKY